MNNKKFLSLDNGIFFGIALLLWIYLWIRAYIVPMAHDEIATYFYYVATAKFLPYYSLWDANNHLLNSLLTCISYNIIDSSPIALRIPNLLTFPIFVWYIFKISGELSTKIFRWVFVVSLLFAHYFIEFFALSRGYGMSMAFITAAIWYLILIFKKEDSLKHYFLSLIFIFLAISCNLTLINTYAIIIALLLMNIIIKFSLNNKKESFKRIALTFVLGIVPILLAARYVFDLKAHGGLYAGSQQGFISLTIRTLIDMLTAYDHIALAYFFLSIVVIIGVFYILLLIKKPSIQLLTNRKHLFLYLLAGNAIATIILGKLFNINYPEDRLGLYFFPLFVGALVFTTEEIYIIYKKKIFFILLLPLLFMPIHFITHINFTYTNCYKTDMIPQRFYDKVYNDYKPWQYPPSVGGDRLRHFCWSYLDYRNGGKLSQIFWKSDSCNETDFLIIDKQDYPKHIHYYDSIDYYKPNNRYLLKRKHPVTKTLIKEFNIDAKNNYTDEFCNLAKGNADTLKGKTLYFTYKLTVESNEEPFRSWIVITVYDKKGKEIRYEYTALDWLRSYWNGDKDNFINAMYVYQLPDDAAEYVTYIWNINKVPFYIKEGKVGIYNVDTK